MDTLSARNLARYGLRRGAYDGGTRRRFVLFCASMFETGIEERREYDTKRERDDAAMREIEYRRGWRDAAGQIECAYHGNGGPFAKYFD